MTQELITKTEYAARAGVTPGMVTRLIAADLAAAVVGKRIDAGHPAAVAYVEERRRAGKAPPPPEKVPHVRGTAARKESRKVGSDSAPLQIPPNIAEFLDWTLRDLIDQFGTDVRFVDWLRAVKEIEVIREKRVKNAERESALIPRELVRSHILGPIEQAHINLLTDGAQTIAARSVAMVKAGEDVTAVRKFVASTITKNIRALKGKTDRVLDNA